MAKILVLEDDEKLRTMLCQVFQAEGYHADAAASGLEAIALAAQQFYDLVIADIRMEGVDGLEALARMKESRPDMRSLVMTGYSTEADSIRAIRLGVGDYLQKPFNLDDLLAAVERLLAARRSELEKRAQESLLRRSLLRAVEAVARSLDLAGVPGRPSGGLVALAGRARRLAEMRALSSEVQDEVQLAATLVALQRCGGDIGLVAEEEELPPSLQRCLRHVEERWDGRGLPDGLAGEEIPLESRLVAFAVDHSEAGSADAGRFDPELLAESETTTAPQQAAEVQGLLSLGQALEAAGQHHEARHAYQQIREGGPSRARVEAMLGLARLSDARQSQELCLEALRVAQGLGPGLTAHIAMESGLLLGSRGLPAEALLQQAGRLYRELQSPARQALATLALAAHGSTVAELHLQGALELLARPEHRDEVGLHLGWLAPWLLSSSHLESGAGLRIAQRLVGEPRLLRLLRRGKLERGARDFLLSQLESGAQASPLLEALRDDPDHALRQRALALAGPALRNIQELRISTLGPMEVHRGDKRIANSSWRSHKARFILAYLAAHPRPVSEDVLIDLFWPEDADKGKRSLYWVSSILRGCLRSSEDPSDLDAIVRHQGMLRLNPALPRWHDLEQLEGLIQAAHKQHGVEQLESLRRAVALYRGNFLEGCYMDWAEPIRERTFRSVCDSLLALAVKSQQAGRAAESLEHAQRLWELDNCRQDACLAAMQALQTLGRCEEAVRLFDRCRKALQRELEMEPSIALIEAQQRALLGLSR